MRTVDVCAEVDLADVVVLQDGGVPGVGSVVGSTMVEGAAGGEGQAGVQPVLLYQLPGAILQTLAEAAEEGESGKLFVSDAETSGTS